MATQTYSLVGWCSDHEAYTFPPEPSCPGDSEYERCHYRKRRMFVCPMPDHCEGQAYFKLADLKAHMRDED